MPNISILTDKQTYTWIQSLEIICMSGLSSPFSSQLKYHPFKDTQSITLWKVVHSQSCHITMLLTLLGKPPSEHTMFIHSFAQLLFIFPSYKFHEGKRPNLSYSLLSSQYLQEKFASNGNDKYLVSKWKIPVG